MRVNPRCRADGIDIAQHIGAAAAVAADAAVAGWCGVDERRMMHRDQHCARIGLALDTFELRGEERELGIGHAGPATALARDDAGIFERVREQADDAHEGRVEREIHAGLRHCSAVQRSCLARDHRRGRAELAREGDQRLVARRSARQDETIVVTRYGEDGCGIGAEGFVELIVAIAALAEIIDDIA